MSGVAVINYLLSNDAGVTAVVPAARIFSGPIPQKTALPAIGIGQITGLKAIAVEGDEMMRMHRIQVTVHAPAYQTKKEILALVDAALPKHPGAVNGIKVDGIIPDLEGPDLDDPGLQLFEQSHDFMVHWHTS